MWSESLSESGFDFFAEPSPVVRTDPFSEEMAEDGIVAWSKHLLGKRLPVKRNAVFCQERFPFLNVKRVGIHQDAVHVENHGGGSD
jgi:hypothetical protein